MRNIRLIWLAAITLVFQMQPAAGEDTTDAKLGERNYQYGVQCYRLKRYNEAAGYFSEAIKYGQYGASLLLYRGHSYFACGRTGDAVESYKRIIEAFPTSPEAAVARQSLSRISPDALKTRTGSTSSAPTIKPLLDRIEIVRPIISHPELQQSTIRTVKETVEGLPAKIKDILDKGGVKFCLTTTLIDKLPGLGYEEAGGYDGGTYKSCPGMFWKDTIYICERTVSEANDSVSAPRSGEDIRGTVLHEIGHALDSCLDDYSESEEYRHAYYLDIAQVSDSMAVKIRYYLQKSVAGQNESCGELTSILLGNARNNDADLQACFPNTMKVIKKKLGL